MKAKIIPLFFTAVLVLSFISGCASVKVTRTEVDKTVDLSGSWNDTDSRLVAENMVKDSLARPWVSVFQQKNGRAPTVIVGTILNKSSEHIDSQIFISDLEMNLINSGSVKFVASSQNREELREEKKDQQTGYTSDETQKPLTEELGADFMLQGSINSVKDSLRNKYAILYQVTLEMVNLTTNEKVWIGQKEIKKVVSRSSLSL